MNNLAEQPLVIRTAGGKNGGGTQLTAYGKQAVALYRALQTEYQQAPPGFNNSCRVHRVSKTMIIMILANFVVYSPYSECAAVPVINL